MNNTDKNKEYRSLCEQGDLGLFGELFNEADQRTLNSEDKKSKEDSDK